MTFRRIGDEVVELRPRSLDVLEPGVLERKKLAPAERESRIERFGVDAPSRRVLRIPIEEARPLAAGGEIEPDDRERGWQDVEKRDRPRHAFSGAPSFRKLDEQRNSD